VKRKGFVKTDVVSHTEKKEREGERERRKNETFTFSYLLFQQRLLPLDEALI